MRRALLVLVGMLAGCSALLGIEDGAFDPAATPLLDAGAPRDGAPVVLPAEEDRDAAGAPTDAGEDGATARESCIGFDADPHHCILAQESGSLPARLVVTDTHVFWRTGRAIRRRSIAGGPAETLFEATTAGGTGFNFVALGDSVYFADQPGRRVARCPLLGPCGVAATVFDVDKPWFLATVGSDLFALEGTFGSRIFACRSAPCAQAEVFATGPKNFSVIAAGAQDVVWGTTSMEGVATVLTVPASGGTTPIPRTLFNTTSGGLFGVIALAVIGRNVYFVFAADLYVVSLDGTPAPKRLLEGIGSTDSLRADGEDLTYTDYNKGIVYRRPADATTPSIVEITSRAPVADAVRTSKGLFWTSKDRVMRYLP